MTPMEITPEALEALIRRHRQLNSEVAEIKSEMAVIVEQIREAVPVGWSLNVDGVKASVREPNRSFDLVTAVSLLSPEAKANCVLTSYEPKLVRKAIEEAGQLEACMLPALDKEAVVKL